MVQYRLWRNFPQNEWKIQINFMAILCDRFGMFKGPFQRLLVNLVNISQIGSLPQVRVKIKNV